MYKCPKCQEPLFWLGDNHSEDSYGNIDTYYYLYVCDECHLEVTIIERDDDNV